MRDYVQELEIMPDYHTARVMLWLPPSKKGAWISFDQIEDREQEPVKDKIKHLTGNKITPTDEEIYFILDRAKAKIDEGGAEQAHF